MIQENHQVEFKRTLNDKFEKEIVAFLNSRDGGAVYIGIDDSGRPVDIQDPDQIQLDIASRLRDKILPTTMGLFEIKTESIDGKTVIRVSVSSGTEKPYYIKDKGMSPAGCFTRVGSASVPMTIHQINELYANQIPTTLKNIPSPWDELSFKQLQIYYASHYHPLNEQFLKSLELLTTDNRYNYAAYLLADENANSVRVAKYAGTDKIELIENEEYGFCSIIKTTERLLDKMLVENRTFCKITSTVRIEKPMMDPIALREIVINAIVHNDYSQEYTPIFEFFSDRLEITSYGGLQNKQSESDMFSGASMPRNRILMRVFRDLDFVERIGSGMPRILKAYGRDIYDIQDHFIRITIPYASASELDENNPIDPSEVTKENGEVTKETDEVTKENDRVTKETDGVTKETDEVTKETDGVTKETDEVTKETDGVTKETGNADNLATRVLEGLKAHPEISVKALAEQLGMKRETVQYHINRLKEFKRIQHVGPTKGGQWVVL